MKVIDVTKLSKDIHFPINRAVYIKPPKRSWWKKIWKFITYKRHYELRQDYVLWIPKLKKYIFIPSPFFYDNASVPKLASSLYNADGMLLLGSLPHDFGYRYECLIFVNKRTGELEIQTYTKKELDALFQYICAYESGFKKASWVAKSVLSLAGFAGWNSNRKKNCDLCADFPEIFVTEES